MGEEWEAGIRVPAFHLIVGARRELNDLKNRADCVNEIRNYLS